VPDRVFHKRRQAIPKATIPNDPDSGNWNASTAAPGWPEASRSNNWKLRLALPKLLTIPGPAANASANTLISRRKGEPSGNCA
jgi:hypothetical protein